MSLKWEALLLLNHDAQQWFNSKQISIKKNLLVVESCFRGYYCNSGVFLFVFFDTIRSCFNFFIIVDLQCSAWLSHFTVQEKLSELISFCLRISYIIPYMRHLQKLLMRINFLFVSAYFPSHFSRGSHSVS